MPACGSLNRARTKEFLVPFLRCRCGHFSSAKASVLRAETKGQTAIGHLNPDTLVSLKAFRGRGGDGKKVGKSEQRGSNEFYLWVEETETGRDELDKTNYDQRQN